MKKEERILCKSCGKNFGYLSFYKNCKKCLQLHLNHNENVICRRCHRNHVTYPTDPMCCICYKIVERKNRKLVEIYHKTGVILDEEDVE